MTDPGPVAPLPTSPIPPQSLDAEESILGAMMLSPLAIDAVAEHLHPSGREFYRASHGMIYAAMVGLHDRGEPVDAITVVDELDRLGELEAALGAERIHELAALVPAASNAAHYARIVSDMAVLRSLIRVGNDVARLGFDRPGTSPELLEQAEQLIFDVSQERSRSDLTRTRDAIPVAFARLRDLSENGRQIIGVPSGFGLLDSLTSGFQPGDLIVLAARPSMGKSALAMAFLANVSIRSELPTVLFTLEMSEPQVMQRLLSSEGMVDSQKIRNGRDLNSEDWERVIGASDRVQRAPIFVDDSGLITVGEIRSKTRRLKMRYPNLGLVVIDYLQLMASGGNEENRVQEVSKISRSLKILAGELNTPVIALSQLSRNVESRHDKRPMLSDLRESGSIEQDADVVLMLYRDEYYNPEEIDVAGIAEVNIAKQRNGPTGTVKLAWQKKYARFGELQR